MRILVTSDSHRNTSALQRAAEKAKPFDTFIFLGDGEDDYSTVTMKMGGINTYCVRGNCDWGMTAAAAVVEAEGYKLLICHGHTFGVRDGLDSLAAAAVSNGCSAALFGHTHCRHFSREHGVYLFNPGSVSLSRDGQPPSYGIITIENGKLDFYHFDV